MAESVCSSSRTAWRTPTAEDVGFRAESLVAADGGPARAGERAYRTRPDGSVVNVQQTLGLQVRLGGAWQTPATFLGKYRRQVGQATRAEKLLPAQAEDRDWATPTVSDSGRNKEQSTLRRVLARETMAWPMSGRPTKGEELPLFPCGLPDPTTEKGGPPSSSPARSSRRLSPPFVEWLMGWPIGWTAFEPVGTEWSRWWRAMRSASFELALRPDPWRTDR